MFKLITAVATGIISTVGYMTGAAVGKELYKSAEFLIKGAYIPALFGDEDEKVEKEKQKPEEK